MKKEHDDCLRKRPLMDITFLLLVGLSPDIRGAFRKLTKQNLAVTGIAKMFNTTRQTVYRWLGRGKHPGSETFKDKPRQPRERKVTAEVELGILKLRTTFRWGTACIQQGFYNLPPLHRGFSTVRSRSKALKRNHKQRSRKK